MRKLSMLWYNYSKDKTYKDDLIQDLVDKMLYLIMCYVIFPYLNPDPPFWWIFNSVYLIWSWWNYLGLEVCSWQFARDCVNTTIFELAAHYHLYAYPYLEPHSEGWWILHILYVFLMEDHFYIKIHPQSPWLPVVLVFMWRVYNGFKETENKETKRDERLLMQNKMPLKNAPDNKKMTRKEELQQSLVEQSEKLKKCEEIFEDWSSSKAKEMVKLMSEETNIGDQMSSYCRQRDRVREEIARLEMESKDLAKRIVETETKKNKLAKTRHKAEAHTDERLYEQKIEKAKILDTIQKIGLDLRMIQDNNKKQIDTLKENSEERIDLKAERTQQLAKEIEEKERDLECPVCFDVCTRPVYMCHLSHQICSQCRPKMKVCPQCREAYKKHKLRHKEKETTSDQLELLYKNMRELLESD